MSTRTSIAVLAVAVAQATALQAQSPPARASAQLPDAPGRDATQRVCGSTCHRPDMLMGSGRTRDQWTSVVNSMVARGAKATEPELVQIINYLATNFGPNYSPSAARTPVNTATTGSNERPMRGITGRGPGPLGAGAADSHVVDNAGADRGKAVYDAECNSCHGLKARGGNDALPANQRGPDLVRSLL